MICDRWDVVVVPFPFTERAGGKRRPALVISPRPFNEHGHTLLSMITTKDHRRWPGDCVIEDLTSAGLTASCIVRLKLFTLDNRLIIKHLGELGLGDRMNVEMGLSHLFG